MKKLLEAFVYAFVTTAVVAVSFTNAQNLFDQKEVGFVGSVSVKVYCAFSPVFGGDNTACNSTIDVEDKTGDEGTKQNGENKTVLTTPKQNQITQVINRTLNNPGQVVYVQGPAGRDGKNGTTTVIYETRIAGQVVSPTAYINPGPSNQPVFQTTVPGDIWQTFIHQLQFGNAWGSNLSSVNVTASNTNTINLTATNFTLGTGTISTTTIANANVQNLWANNATTLNSTSTNLFSSYASITEATTTNIYSLIASFIELFAINATITNATTTDLFSSNASITNATTTNLFAHLASVTEATSTILFAHNASITEATTTYLFAAWANFLNLFVGTLTFDSATGTNLQVANASTTNLVATGTTNLTNAFIASSTQFNSSINSGNATLTTLVSGNATTTNLFAEKGSITNSTSTTLFANLASITAATTTNLFTAWFNALNAIFTNLTATNATITNATTTNLAVNTISNVGTNPITFRTNGANQDFVFAPNGVEVMRISETGQEVFIAPNNDLYVGDDITGRDIFASTSVVTNSTTTNLFSANASLTNATTTNLFASVARILSLWVNSLSANIINVATLNATSSVNTLVLNASTTNATTTNTNNLLAVNATLTNATITNLYSIAGDRTLGTTTMYGSLIPYASTSWMTLGTLANPWSELFVSSSSVYIGGTKISNVDGQLVWGGNRIVTFVGTSSVIESAVLNASTTNASTTNTENLLATNGTVTNATSTNLFANLFKATNATIDGLMATNSVMVSLLSTNVTATAISALSANITNLLSTSILASNITGGNIIATSSIGTNVLVATTTISQTASTTNLVVSNIGTGVGNATITVAASLEPSVDSIFDLGSATKKWRDLWVSSSTVHIGNASLSVDASGTLLVNGVEILSASSTPVLKAATLTQATSTNLFASWFKAMNASMDNLLAVNATLTNATSTNFFAVNLFANMFRATNATIDSLTTQNILAGNVVATGTVTASNLVASTTNTLNLLTTNGTVTNATSTNLFATNANFTNLSIANVNVNTATATNLVFNTQNGRATSTTFAANSTIGNTDNFAVFNLIASNPNLDFALATPTNLTAGKIIYVNNVGANSFAISGSVITTDTGRTFVWTGTKWSLNADGVGSAPTSSTIKKVLSADQIKTNDTQTFISDLSWSVSGRETWYFTIVGSLTGGDNTNNGMEVQVSAPSGSTACSTTLTNFDMDNNWTTAVCNGVISGSSNWPSQSNFKVEGIFTTGVGGGSARFIWAKNANGGNNLVLSASSTVLTAVKMNGADLAEVYYSENGPIGYGEIVSLEGTGVSQIIKSQKAYDNKAVGIVSTRPGHILGEADGTGVPVVVGLSGRVPVKVTAKNGEIKPGDFITTSDIPGVGMKATKEGRVVGKALTGFAGTGDEIGMVQVFIQNTYYEGDADEGISERITLATGAIADKFTNNIKKSFENLSNVMLSMTLWVNELKASTVTADKTVVREFCVGNECFTEADMKEFRNYLNSKKPVETISNPTSENTNPVAENIVAENPTSTEVVVPVEVAEPVEQINVTAPEVVNNTENTQEVISN